MHKPRVDVMIYGENPAAALPVVSGLMAFAASKGRWRVLLRSIDDPHLIHRLKTSVAEGIITMAGSEEQGREFADIGKPIVNVITPFMPGTPSVMIDDVQVGRMAAKHLLDRGLRQFGYLGVDILSSRQREKGFTEELEARGFVGHLAAPPGDPDRRWDWSSILMGTCIQDWLSTLPRPIGILAFNDIVAVQIIEACEHLGLRVPEDISVLGVDNDELQCRFAPVSLSSVDNGLHRVGYEAGNLLHRLMTGEKISRKPLIVPPQQVVMRHSTEVLAVDDDHVRDALHFIREHACDPIRVEDILDRIPLSRSTLERRFLVAVGRLPGEEIRRVRLDEARRLLASTQLSLITVALQCGFPNQQHLGTAFKKAFGLSPGAFRKSLHNAS